MAYIRLDACQWKTWVIEIIWSFIEIGKYRLLVRSLLYLDLLPNLLFNSSVLNPLNLTVIFYLLWKVEYSQPAYKAMHMLIYQIIFNWKTFLPPTIVASNHHMESPMSALIAMLVHFIWNSTIVSDPARGQHRSPSFIMKETLLSKLLPNFEIIDWSYSQLSV